MSEDRALPEGWGIAILGEVCTRPQYGYTTSGLETGDIKLLRTTDITSGSIDWSTVPFCREIPKDSEKYLLKDRDIVISRAGSIGISHWVRNPQKSVFASYLIRFRPISKVMRDEFLLYFLNSQFYWSQISEKSLGIAIPNVNASKLKEIRLPLPPLREQHRIVAKIEELFSSLDKGVDDLKTAQQQLKVYRQAVLKWAFEGKLTHKNIVDGGLPNGWCCSRMGEIAELCLGKMLDAKKNRGTLQPYLRNSNVRWGHVDLSDLQEMKFTPEDEERYGIRKGDLIICEGGEPGRAAIWDEALPNMKIQKALHRVRLNDQADSKYVLYNLMLGSENGHLSKYFTGTTIKHLPGEKLKSYSIPICSLAEQQHIVSEIESRLSVCEKIEETINDVLKQAESLRQSILKKAFEGKLVPQEPNDEPASVLLARIKAERESSKAEAPRQRQRERKEAKKAQS
jgi:type I restriction enzyme, S subunit